MGGAGGEVGGKDPGDIAKSLIAGGIAGSLAKTVVAPLERVKILFQVHNQTVTTISSLRQILQTEGGLAMWKGNTAVCVRVSPYSAIQYVAYDFLEEKGRRKVCAQAEPQLQHILARKRVSGKYWPRTALLIRSSVKCLAIQRHVSSGQGWPCAPLCASTRVGDNFFTRTITCAARPGLERARVILMCPS